jgi:hypothetical protein
VLLLVEGDLDLSSPFFLCRFRELLTRGWTILEAADSLCPGDSTAKAGFEHLLAQDLMNSICCEGLDRGVRPERLEQWADRMQSLGFAAVPFGADVWESFGALSGLDSRMKVAKSGPFARLCWRDVPLVFAGAWAPD